VFLLHVCAVRGNGCSLPESHDDVPTYIFGADDEVRLCHWDGRVAICCARHGYRCHVLLGALVAFNVQLFHHGQWSVGVFVLVTLDVMKGYSDWAAFGSCVADRRINVVVVGGGVIGSSGTCSHFRNIC